MISARTTRTPTTGSSCSRPAAASSTDESRRGSRPSSTGCQRRRGSVRRSGDRSRCGRSHRRCRATTSSCGRGALDGRRARRPARRRRLRQRRGRPPSRPLRCAALGAEVDVMHAEPDGPNINDRLRVDPPRATSRRRCRATGPTPGWPSTATPTGCSPSTTPGRLVDGDQHHRHLRPRPARAGRAPGRHRRGHRDDQPRVPAGHGRAADHGRRDPGRRPLRARGPGGGRLSLGRRAVRPRDLPATWPPPATACSPACRCSTSSAVAASRSPSWRPVP